MKKEKRSTKWTFLIYKESAPENYLEILENIHVPFVLSPWHNKDINSATGEIKKSHKHGALFFDSLKSYSQVSELISENLNGPTHVEIVMSPKGMFDYFTHAQNHDKTPYNIDDIEYGAGFDIDNFLLKQNSKAFMNEVIDIIETKDFTEIQDLIKYARDNNYLLLNLIVDKTYFFARYLDSRRHHPVKNKEES
ncbi:replication protein [Staphylococcus aureus]|uniref:replication protein n=1 Tax=Staphylococcus aureus TaxID=1280 RepID=UPI001BA3936B|nr:replication protein [Staphylococcus aureus]HCV0109495.1 replication protein [Staphylococcus aureus]